MTRISVMIPAYNGASFIGQALDSILKQGDIDFDITVIDDASSDGTPDVVRPFPQVRLVLNSRNLGLPANFNRCLEEARSPYVCLFCQDDIMESGNLAAKVRALDRHETAGMAFSNAGFVDVEGKRESSKTWNRDLPGDSILRGQWFLRRLILKDNPVCLSGAVFRTELARRTGGFDTRFHQNLDWHLWMKMAIHLDVAYLGGSLISYRRHPGTATLKRDPCTNIIDVYKAKLDILKRYRHEIPGAEILLDQFRTHFAKGAIFSSFRNWFTGYRDQAFTLIPVWLPLIADPPFLGKAMLLGCLQALLGRHEYPSLFSERDIIRARLD